MYHDRRTSNVEPHLDEKFFTGFKNAMAIYAAIGMVMLVVLRWSGVI